MVEDEPNLLIDNFKLEQNYPNPFNSTTNIKYTIPQSGRVTLTVYDMMGSEVAVLLNRYQEAGSYDVIFQAKDLASGIYFYTLTSGNFTATKKLILLK
ncbi:MAG: T9SS type A sorting domain-containing protein [Ignavibacteriota bacterium]|nr:T9SS type A sorting domain-containing protein [Ignavibacteriales bacterium]QKJ97881.1 MAG: T9SS type A sorting domain-containing protein [Ignavibacteriota bacterium]